MGIIADTSLLVDMDRGQPAARDFIVRYQPMVVTTWICVGELMVGHSGPTFAIEIIRDMTILGIGEAASYEYARIRRLLKQKGQMIGANDLWIAAIALANNHAVVTRNTGEFSRVPSLTVMSY